MSKRQAIIIGIFVLLSLVVGYIVVPDLKTRLKIGADTSGKTTEAGPHVPVPISTPPVDGTPAGTPPPGGGTGVTTTIGTPPPGGTTTPTTSGTASTPPAGGVSPTTTVALPPGDPAYSPPTFSTSTTPAITSTDVSDPPDGLTGSSTTTPAITDVVVSDPPIYKTPPIVLTPITDPKLPQYYDQCVGDICWGVKVDCIGGDCLPPQDKEPEEFFTSDPPLLKEKEEAIRQIIASGPGICKDNIADCNDATVASLCSVCAQKNGFIESDAPLVVFSVKTKLRQDPYNKSKYIAEISWRTNKPATGQVAYVETTKRTTAYDKKTLENTESSNFHSFIIPVHAHANYHFAVGSRTATEKVVSSDFEFLSGRYYDNLWTMILKILSSAFR